MHDRGMSSSSSHHPLPADAFRASRFALLAFVTNGALIGSLLPRYPEIADALDLSTARLGLVVVCFAVGAAMAGSLPQIPLRRFGTRRVTVAGTWGIAFALWLAALSVSVGPSATWWFAACLATAGFGDAIVDVSQNAQGLRVQQALGRSVLSRMHAGWSAGAAVAGTVGTAAASLGVPLGIHLALTGIVLGAMAAVAGRGFLADRGPSSPPPDVAPSRTDPDVAEHRPDRLGEALSPAGRTVLLVLVPIALGGLAVEVVGTDWAAWFLHQVHDVPVAGAGIGVATVLGAQFLGRMVGDRVIDRLGRRRALRVGLGGVVVGLLLAAWSPALVPALVGLALAGAGSAVTVPVAFAEADALPGLPAGRGLATVGWAMRAATLGVSPTVGAVGGALGLSVALSFVAAVAAVATIATAGLPDSPAP